MRGLSRERPGGPGWARPPADDDATGQHPPRSSFTLRRTLAAGGPAAAGLASLAAIGLLAGGCSGSGTGMRDEGAAGPVPAERSVPSRAATPGRPAPAVDPIALLRQDPKVSKRIKDKLKPCASPDSYPVNTSYGILTGGDTPDVVVNVMTCRDGIGIAAYVYRADGATPSDSRPAGGSAAGRAKGPAAGRSTAPAPSPDASAPSASPSASVSQGAAPAQVKAPGKGGPVTYKNVFADEQPAIYAKIDRGELVVTQQVYAKGDPASYPSGEDVITYDWADTKFTVRYRVHNNYSRSVGGGDGMDVPVPAPSGETN